MSSILPKPKVKAPTPAAPDPVDGAEDLQLGASGPSDTAGKGMIGRLRLRTK
jgi:hypothetical protein